jgi:deoxyadenosine/deoxycytidine kinase
VPGNQLEKASMLEMFYNDISGMGFAFQVYVFNSRLERLVQRLAAIAPSSQPRRIIVISERTMLSDRVFYHTVSDQNREEAVAHAEALRFIYDQFFATICGDVLQKEKRLIYLPTAPDVCATRKQIRDRDGEKVSADYLNRLDKQHRRMVNQFGDEHGQEAVLRLDEFNQHMTVAQIDATVSTFMSGLFV